MGIEFDCPRFGGRHVLLAQRLDIHKRISGVSPRPPAQFLRDDSDADDARDAVFRTSLYHIPDSASLASSASFRFYVFRNIIIFVSSSSKLQASFHYKRDGGDDGDDLSCIPLPISHKHRHYRHHRHLKQASRFNLRLACFILSNVAGFLPYCLLKWIQIFCKSARVFSTMGDMLFLKCNFGVQASS